MGASTHPRIDSRKYRGPEQSIRAAILILRELVAPLSSGVTSSQSLSIAARNEHSGPRYMSLGWVPLVPKAPTPSSTQYVRLCSVGTEQRRTSYDGRKDLGSFLPSCIEWLGSVPTEPSHSLHDGRKDPRSFLPSCPSREGREDARSSLPSCKVNFESSMRGWVLAPIHALIHRMYCGLERSFRAAILSFLYHNM